MVSMDKNPYNKNYFEYITCQKGYSKNPLLRLSRQLIFSIQPLFRALMVKIFLRPENLLDVGCGTGRFVYWARKLGIDAWGVDVSYYALSLSSPEIGKWLKKADASKKLPFEDDSFDLVISTSLLEHLSEHALVSTIREGQRVSKKFVLHKIFTDSLFQPRVDDPTHITVKSPTWWHEFFKKIQIEEGSKNFPRWEPGLFLLEKNAN